MHGANMKIMIMLCCYTERLFCGTMCPLDLSQIYFQNFYTILAFRLLPNKFVHNADVRNENSPQNSHLLSFSCAPQRSSSLSLTCFNSKISTFRLVCLQQDDRIHNLYNYKAMDFLLFPQYK